MCIIACKPAGVGMPDIETITNMWTSNHDGAGIMYSTGGRVKIEKGFMKLDNFLAALKRIEETTDLTHTGVVMHFRITTHGGTTPENTHPFPISSSVPMLKKLEVTTDIGVAHNGIIHIVPRSKDISDTMEYIASQLAPLKAALPRFWTNKNAMLLVKNAIDSKMAFLDGTGKIYTIGDFVEHEGMLYSNHTYEDYWKTARNTAYWGWDYGENGWERSTYTPDHVTYLDPEGYEYDDRLITPHYLTMLTDVPGAFYSTVDGELEEDYDFSIGIDYKGRVWEIEWDIGLAFRADDYVTGVYNSSGNRLAYNSTIATIVDCYDFDAGLLSLPMNISTSTDKKGKKKGGK